MCHALPNPLGVALNGASHGVLWQGSAEGVDSETIVKIKINGSATETVMPVKVKAMKYREVELAVYRANELKPNGNIVPPDNIMMPTEQQRRQHLNELFAYQLNTWFQVNFIPQTESVNFGILEAGDEDGLPVDQTSIIDAFGGLNASADIHLFLIGTTSVNDQGRRGFADPDSESCWVVVAHNGASYNQADEVMDVVGYEIGHIFFGVGHPDSEAFPGPAPLSGTDQTKRLMYSASDANSRLIVKKEWDEAEEWLKVYIDAPDQ